jgi:hypothetical protein
VFRQRFDAGVIAVRVGVDSVGTPTILRPLTEGAVVLDDGSGRMDRQSQKVIEATPTRTAVHDDTIYTLTPVGIAVHDGTSLTRLTFAAF